MLKHHESRSRIKCPTARLPVAAVTPLKAVRHSVFSLVSLAILAVLLVAMTAGQVAAQQPSSKAQLTSQTPESGESIATEIRIATFDLDATPPVGAPLAYDPVRRHGEIGLRCKGLVIQGAGQPIVLCAMDWIGISNEAHDAFRNVLAEAAGTDPGRVALHCLHQHDAPRCDFTAEAILNHVGSTSLGPFDNSYARQFLGSLEQAVRQAAGSATTVTHIGFGTAEVQQVASNRRLLDDNGKVYATRYTTCRDPKLRAVPEGTIDPDLNAVVFYAGDKPVASLTYYACHPQSYYRTGVPSPDFPGLARIIRGEDAPETFHMHFNGAGGNIGAGKYNDGNKANRLVLAGRLASAMQQAMESAKPMPLPADAVNLQSVAVALPAAEHLNKDALLELLSDPTPAVVANTPADLAWLKRCQEEHKIDVSCLQLGGIRILHLPGELFVEFQLAAKAMRPDLNVTLAAYGDYGPGYIGTEIAYSQGGYETSARASRVSPKSEAILIGAIEKLLDVKAPEK